MYVDNIMTWENWRKFFAMLGTTIIDDDSGLRNEKEYDLATAYAGLRNCTVMGLRAN